LARVALGDQRLAAEPDLARGQHGGPERALGVGHGDCDELFAELALLGTNRLWQVAGLEHRRQPDAVPWLPAGDGGALAVATLDDEVAHRKGRRRGKEDGAVPVTLGSSDGGEHRDLIRRVE